MIFLNSNVSALAFFKENKNYWTTDIKLRNVKRRESMRYNICVFYIF